MVRRGHIARSQGISSGFCREHTVYRYPSKGRCKLPEWKKSLRSQTLSPCQAAKIVHGLWSRTRLYIGWQKTKEGFELWYWRTVCFTTRGTTDKGCGLRSLRRTVNKCWSEFVEPVEALLLWSKIWLGKEWEEAQISTLYQLVLSYRTHQGTRRWIR